VRAVAKRDKMGFGKVSTAFFTSALLSPGDGTGHRVATSAAMPPSSSAGKMAQRREAASATAALARIVSGYQQHVRFRRHHRRVGTRNKSVHRTVQGSAGDLPRRLVAPPQTLGGTSTTP
jgi:hypothetical protein